MSKTIKRKAAKRIVLGRSLLDEAGLGEDIEILVQEGAIFICSAVKPQGWKAWESLGKDAVEGKIANPSERHDHILYGEKGDIH